MEQFTLLEGNKTLRDSREQINNALSTVRSLSSGTTFPTTDLSDGMLCYRTDHGRLYQLADAATGTWTDKVSMNIEGSASTLTTPRKINGVEFDGSKDIELLTRLPVGFEYYQTNPNIQAGSIPMIGGLWDRTIYADLWAWVQKQGAYLISEAEWQEKASANGGAVAFYSDGDGSTTFRVPALTVYCKGKNGDEAIGDYLADTFASHKHNVSATTNETGAHTHTRGTMDITGAFRLSGTEYLGTELFSGAFSYSGAKGGTFAEGHNNKANNPQVNFKAADSWTGSTSSNGKHSHTVTITEATQGSDETRPKTIVGVYCVVAYSYLTNSGSVDLDSIADLLNEAQQTVWDAKTSVNVVADSTDSTHYVPFVSGSGYQTTKYSSKLTFNPSTGALAATTVTSAVYNDYAEFFPRGEDTEAGDIIALDTSSDTERYIKASGNCIVAGIHSDEYAHIIGGEEAPDGVDFIEYNLPKYIPVSLAGRVHVKVAGKVNAGDYIVTSDIAGIGKADNNPTNIRQIVGYAVEASDDLGIKKIRVRVKGA